MSWEVPGVGTAGTGGGLTASQGMRRFPSTRAAAFGAALLLTTLVAATPCAACSCAEAASPAEAASDHDVVFVGTLVDERRSPVRVPGLSGGQETVAAVFEVTEVRKGEAARRTEIRTDLSGASCGLEVEPGVPYVLVADETPDGLTSSLCDGSRPLSDVTTADLDAVGPALAPADGVRAADLPVVESSVGPVLLVVGAPVAAVLALLAAGWALLRRRRRRPLR